MTFVRTFISRVDWPKSLQTKCSIEENNYTKVEEKHFSQPHVMWIGKNFEREIRIL